MKHQATSIAVAGGPALWAASCVVTLLAGCTGEPPEHGLRMLAEGRRLLQAGQPQAAVQQLDQFLRDFARTTRGGEGYYLRGEAYFRQKDYDRARADFLQALNRSSDRLVRGNADAALGDLAQRRAEMPAAEDYYTDALALLPPSEPPSDAVAVRLGEVLQQAGKWEQADTQFHRVIHTFPGSDAAGQAGRLVNARAWTVCAGRFTDPQAAAAQARQLQQSRHEARVEVMFGDKGPVHAVCVGRFNTRPEGRAKLAEIQPLLAKAELAVTK